MEQEKFDVIVDDDNIDILDWIGNHFENGNWYKHFEATVTMREFTYTEDGSKVYLEEDK